MEYAEENSYTRTSQLRPPNRYASPGKGLHEISESQSNARSKIPSKMHPPSTYNTMKHKLPPSNNEPEPKHRKTLAERAGEPISNGTTTTDSRPPVKGTTIVGASASRHGRTNSFASSVSSRPPSASSRSTSNSSFASSMGPGARPYNSMPLNRSTSGRPATSYSRARPVTATAKRFEDDSAAQGKHMAWDVDKRIENMESMYSNLIDQFQGTSNERALLEETIGLHRGKIAELEALRAKESSMNITLQTNLDTARDQVQELREKQLKLITDYEDQLRTLRYELDDTKRDRKHELERLRKDQEDEIDRLERRHQVDLCDSERQAAAKLDKELQEIQKQDDVRLEEEQGKLLREVQDLEARIASEHQNLASSLQKKGFDIQNLRGELEDVKGELDREQTLKSTAQKELAELRETMQKNGVETTSTIGTLESTLASLRAKIHFLESGSKAQSDSFAEMEARLQEAVKIAEVSKQKLIKEETIRRSLFNQVQELKGNIRVMCRIRPVFNEEEPAKITIPDVDKESKELEILGKEEKSSLGNITRKTHAFNFDRVFGPTSENQEVFEEISQLVQSALDGYNVCIFCYGQTGSGKTHTMSSADGMIPRATHQIYGTARNLEDKGWTYTMEGSFVEVYNEEIHDLLGSSKDMDKKKHEIRHNEQRKQTTVTGLKTVPLDSPTSVESILEQAAANRSVATTKSNERSSRSHSVFILKLVGKNSTTNETSEGTLNLVDLAGSERLKQSGAEGDRMKETQNINKSLSCLGDVIGALGQGKEGTHIPYRNSKLTYLLQYSLGGNSKTLMFVMASPLEAHLSETLTSLKFATKVHNTHIGTAKKSTKAH